ncbi:hypothetical protein TrCOL_g9822 [Triparma columacea]|uniref:DHHA2 domain-containing protein n=1 Tax=Triparma columacea TaxID=722753 RepID=A0A9W7LA25_9STRA|nr:hypothetical protein TrCOL_g9822 [Triparma columacea]
MFREVGISPQALLGVDDMLDFVSSNPGLDYTLTLVDHNVPDLPTSHPSTPRLTGRVANILDHHVDEGLQVPDGGRRVVRVPCGSTCTIVHSEGLLSGGFHWDVVGMKMLGTTIKVDTGDLSTSMGKTTPSDVLSLQTIMKELGDEGDDMGGMYKRVVDAKFNVDFWRGLDITEVKDMDFKTFSNVGVASVLLGAGDVKVKGGELGVGDGDLLVFMCMKIVEGKPEREIILVEGLGGGGLGEKVREGLERDEELGLEEVEKYERWGGKARAYKQRNEKASRKILGPKINEIVKGIKED